MKRLLVGLGLLSLPLALACDDDSGTPPTGETVATLTQYQTCSALETDLKDAYVQDILARYEQIKDAQDGFGSSEPGAPDAGTEGAGDGDSSGGRQEGVDYSGTNNQEDGVDEADFVKTDGYNIYVLNGNRLHIYGVPEFGDLDELSVTEVEGYPRQMLVNRDAERAVVFSVIYPWTMPEGHPIHDLLGEYIDEQIGWMWRVNGLTKMTVLDISNRSEPVLERELFVEGSYQTARMAQGSIRVASYAHIQVPGHYGWDWSWYGDGQETLESRRDAAIAAVQSANLADLVPRIHERLPSGNLVTHALTGSACRGFYRPGDSNGNGFTSLFSMNLFGSSLQYDADHVVSNYAQVYASQDNLYIAEHSQMWWWFWWNDDAEQETNIHRFDISTPGEAFYRGSARVDGWVNNQFSLSEHDGHLRVATTTNPWNRWWEEDPDPSENHVWVLKNMSTDMVPVGHVGGIAPGERIFAARFVGDKGYLVTFVQTDPLFTLDLSDPTAPQVIGELHIPGFSNYLHPLDGDRLLGIGVGGDETGANWRTQVSLFDVSDFANPTRADALELALPGGWSWSEARWEHKAFQYWGPEKLLAVPVSSYSWNEGPEGYDYTYLSNLELVKVEPEGDGLSSYGTIDHSDFFNNEDNTWYDYRDIRRSIFMGDYIYAISDRGITVHQLGGLAEVDSSPLPGPNFEYYWWW